MLLSRTSAYAVRATIHLAEREGAGPLRVSEIADALDVPRNYLSKILHQLARAGVLVSERGPRGGFRLAVAPEALHLADVIAAVEPKRVDRRCLLGRAECSDARPCPAHDRWQQIADEIEELLSETTLAALRSRPAARLCRTRRRPQGKTVGRTR